MKKGNNIYIIGLLTKVEVFDGSSMLVAVFWDVVPCFPVEVSPPGPC